MNWKKVKKEIISWGVWIKLWSNRISVFEPMLILMAFIIVLPYLKSYSIRWLFAFCALMIAVKLSVYSIERVWKKEIETKELIQRCKEQIIELQEDVERLEKLSKKKKHGKEVLINLR